MSSFSRAGSMDTDIHVDVGTIEHQLAALWRAEEHEGRRALTRAALWNVVAHTWNGEEHARATEILARASAAVPQRTILIRADRTSDSLPSSISSWISANCHIIGNGQQVCSEEVSIVASGAHIGHVPPLVRALLLPDMPVAVWWLGELPRDHHDYAELLLEPADRLIVDSSQFASASDFDLVLRMASETTTAPADLSWARIEEWRVATATLFDPPAMRERLGAIRVVRVTGGATTHFRAMAEALLYAGWLEAQTIGGAAFEYVPGGPERGISSVELELGDGTRAALRRDREHGTIVATADDGNGATDCIARVLPRKREDLIVRLLKRPEADRVYLKALRAALRLVQ